jgi:geranylgeranyl diphosphate synthase type II
MGMIGGQVVDIGSEGNTIDINKNTLEYIHTHKTGALFRASLRSGALLAGAGQMELERLTFYAEKFGLAFQITDDLLDVTGDQEKLGKPIGSDEKNLKATYPALFGLDESRRLAREAIETAASALQGLPGCTEPLKLLVHYLYSRES